MSARLAEYLQRLERLGEVLEPEAVSILAVAFADADLTTYVAAQLAAAADSDPSGTLRPVGPPGGWVGRRLPLVR